MEVRLNRAVSTEHVGITTYFAHDGTDLGFGRTAVHPTQGSAPLNEYRVELAKYVAGAGNRQAPQVTGLVGVKPRVLLFANALPQSIGFVGSNEGATNFRYTRIN